MPRPARATCVAILALMLAACMPEQPLTIAYSTGARVPGVQNFQMTAGLSLPPGEEKVPVVVLTHDVRGLRDAQMRPWVDALKGSGVAVLVLNHYEPRGIDSSRPLAERLPVSPMDMLQDAWAALDAVADHPRIDRRRAGIIGFGEGGGAAALLAAHAAVAQGRPADKPRFGLHVALYPDCGFRFGNRATMRAPIRILLAERDTRTGTAACTDLADYLRAAGADIRTTVLPNARHGFDDPPGPLRRDPQAENISRCVWQQQGDGTWRERSSGIAGATLFRQGEREERVNAYWRGRGACRTLGAETQGDAGATGRARGEVLGHVQQALVNPPRRR